MVIPHVKHLLAGMGIGIILAMTAPPSFAGAIPVPRPVNRSPSSVIGTMPAKSTARTQADVAAVPESMAAVNAASALVDSAIADKLRNLAGGEFDRIFRSRKEREAVDEFYSARDYSPLWITGGTATGRTRAVISYLKKVDVDGLDPSDYPTPNFKVGAEPGALAEAELRLTAAVLAYTRHAQAGRVHFSRISADIHYKQVVLSPAAVLGELAGVKQIDELLGGLNPQHEGYKALKAALARVRAQTPHDGSRIASGPVLEVARVPMRDPRVPRLRERLGISGNPGDTTYDRRLAEAVAKFQYQHGLDPSGHLDSKTVSMLNRQHRDDIADIIIANMERWRWLPRDLGKAHVILNIPDYALKVVTSGVTVWTTKVVVGKPSTPTPLLSDTIKSITVNPTWNVPPSIVYNEYLPALQQDPQALERLGLKVVQKRDGGIHIYQPPGDNNALGRLRFNFPNKFLVYQHDTPDKHLFARNGRAYSHGCIRVQDPVRYAELLLSIAMPEEGYTQDRIRRMFGHAERNVQLSAPIPVHLTYQTAYVDEGGKLVLREDIYDHDTRMLAALRGNERRVADVAVRRPQPNYNRPRVQLPSAFSQADRRPSFFERLFNGGFATSRVPID